jgi:hypothetical protein
MKKVFVTVAALGLVFGAAGAAFALDTPGAQATSEADTMPRVAQPTAPGVSLWSVSGSWSLAGAYLSNGNGQPGGANVNIDTAADAFYIYSFKVLPVLQVNDKIAVKAELRFADRDVFGLTDTTKISPVAPTPGTIEFDNWQSLVPNYAGVDTGGEVMDIYHLYLEWMSPLGKTRFGRTPCGAWGSQFGNSSSKCNRIMWWPNMMPEGFGMLLFTQKSAERDAGENLTNFVPTYNDNPPAGPSLTDTISFPRTNTNMVSDGDKDAYYIDLSYAADFGKTTAALLFQRDATGSAYPFWRTKLWLHQKYTFNNIFLETELDWNFGENSGAATGANTDEDSLGLFADLGMNMGDMTIGGLFIYASGDDNTADSDKSAFMGANGLGKDFNPYQIMTGDYMNLLNGDNPLAGDGIVSGAANAGVWSIGAYAKYKLSPDLAISGEVGYFAALEEMPLQDSDYGLEFGVGMSYKLYDNLTYNAHFSYLLTGDFFKYGVAAAPTEDIYLMAHALSMKF